MSETCGGILGYPVLEFTSSGLTHSFGGGAGAITALAMALALNPNTRVGYSRGPAAAWDSGAFFGAESFGEIEIEWPDETLAPRPRAEAGGGVVLNTPSCGGRITLRAIDADGKARFEHSVPFDFLAPWPAAHHPHNGLARTDANVVAACAKADPAHGLTAACAAVLASCDGHRDVDLSDANARENSVAVLLFKGVMALTAFVAIGGPLVALSRLALAVARSARTPGSASLRKGQAAADGPPPLRGALLLAVSLGVFCALWWEHIVQPFES